MTKSDIQSAAAKLRWRNKTEADKDAMSTKKSKAMKRYIASLTPEQKAARAEAISTGQVNRWRGMTPRQRRAIMDKVRYTKAKGERKRTCFQKIRLK